MKKLLVLLALLTACLCCTLTANAVIGDPDADGDITAADARYVLRAAVGLEHPMDLAADCSDVDHDGDITAADARLVLRVAVELDRFTHPAPKGDEPTVSIRPATCTGDGVRYYRCSCGEPLLVVLPAKGHTPGKAVTENYVRALCEKAGSYDEAVYCTVCGETLSRKTTVLPARGHTAGDPAEENRVEPTCETAGGYDTAVYCTVCKKELKRDHTGLPELGHTPAEAVTENDVAATCGAQGGYDTVVYCGVCGKELSRDHTVRPALPHADIAAADAPEAYIGAGPVWDGTAFYRCADCGAYFEDAEGQKPLGGFYPALTDALDAAGEGETVILLRDATLKEDADVKAGVTLLLPYGYGQNDIFIRPADNRLPYANAAENDYVITVTPPGTDVSVKLTLSGCTLNVEEGAMLVVGGKYSGSQPVGGATYGAHAEIEVSADAGISIGGTLSTYGYVTGEGEMTLAGGTLYLPLVFTDFHGGTYSAIEYLGHNRMPFNSYACINVRCPVTADGASKVYGYGVLYASGVLNASTSLIIAPEDAFLNLAPDAVLRFVYDADKTVEGYPELGTMAVTAEGDVTVDSIELRAAGLRLDTSQLEFTVPYNFSYLQNSGTVTVKQGLALMPGAAVTVGENASMVLEKTFYVLDGLCAGLYSAYHYPAGDKLSAAGYAERGRFFVDGALTVCDGASFAGIAETHGTGTVDVGEATLSTVFTDGLILNELMVFYTAIATNRTDYALTARLQTGEGIVAMTENTSYAAVSDGETTLTAFAYVKYSGDIENTVTEDVTATYSVPQTVKGVWQKTDD